MDREALSEPFCPMGFVIFPALIGGLVWLCGVLAHMGY